MPAPRRNARRDADIERHYLSGWSSPFIAKVYGISAARVQSILRRRGVTMRAFTGLRPSPWRGNPDAARAAVMRRYAVAV